MRQRSRLKAVLESEASSGNIWAEGYQMVMARFAPWSGMAWSHSRKLFLPLFTKIKNSTIWRVLESHAFVCFCVIKGLTLANINPQAYHFLQEHFCQCNCIHKPAWSDWERGLLKCQSQQSVDKIVVHTHNACLPNSLDQTAPSQVEKGVTIKRTLGSWLTAVRGIHSLPVDQTYFI